MFDVIIIGGGHAGLEAAVAVARMNLKVAIITINKNDLGILSCNPSIGGLGKGNLVNEIDSLDGVMGRLSDKSSIMFKVLNRSKGGAVWGLRSQIDREMYKKNVSALLLEEVYSNIVIIEGSVSDLKIKNNSIVGVILKDGSLVESKTVVLSTGTFLGGLICRGGERFQGGRWGDNHKCLISDKLIDYGFKLSRLKTGTPPRILKSSINYDILEVQSGDENPIFFSKLTRGIELPQMNCHLTYTNEDSHEIILQNKNQSPVLTGNIDYKGPRYCPSIEDKVIRFADKNRHKIFLEPEGLNSDLVYPSGISTSMPVDVQEKFIKSIKGLENAKIDQYGYLVEYNYIDPSALYLTLETKNINNLFFAGQINGTTGYEEAAAQGLVAGINAALRVKQKEGLIINRHDGYIGVMIDDLVNKGVGGEPYRMLTSRSEFRLLCRYDTSDIRLCEIGNSVDVLSENRMEIYNEEMKSRKEIEKILHNYSCLSGDMIKAGIKVSNDGSHRDAFQVLSSGFSLSDVFLIWPEIEKELSVFKDSLVQEIVRNAMYHNYVIRQNNIIKDMMDLRKINLDINFDYSIINTLSNEEVEKLNNFRPETLWSASRIPGITQSGLTSIMMYVRKNNEVKD